MDMDKAHPKACFGNLDVVFPLQDDGLRHTPETCMQCPEKTACLRAAMEGGEGLTLHEEKIDRAYSAGMMSFFERWTRKKSIHRKRKTRQ
ncbi:MAG: hypothetical protein SWH61_06905 [Thermodesulfobacteriota bacterium]|nr:hypothetical protein [Thermodesulfobacteriota bacterium]